MKPIYKIFMLMFATLILAACNDKPEQIKAEAQQVETALVQGVKDPELASAAQLLATETDPNKRKAILEFVIAKYNKIQEGIKTLPIKTEKVTQIKNDLVKSLEELISYMTKSMELQLSNQAIPQDKQNELLTLLKSASDGIEKAQVALKKAKEEG